jgi:hypothetical protein
MQTLLENKYVSVHYYPEFSLLFYTWKPDNYEFDDEHYKAQMREILEIGLSTRPVFVAADFRQSEFVIGPQLQEWLAQEVISQIIAVGMHFLIMIRRNDLIQELSLEQLVDESAHNPYQPIFASSEADMLSFVRRQLDARASA